MVLEQNIDEEDCYVEHIAVSPNLRGKGIGKLLLKKAEEFAKEKQKENISLYVALDNDNARRLYQRIGFLEVKTRNSILSKIFLGKRTFVFMKKPLCTMKNT